MTDLGLLRERARIVGGIRRYFDARDFVEVETAVRIPAPAPEEHIDCPPVVGGGFLRASPELQMKKLLAAGMERIYQIGPCFREGERGTRHNPEFTMIEWYRRGADYGDIRRDLEGLMSALTGREARYPELKVRDAYRRYAGWDPWLEWDRDRFDFDMAAKIEPALGEIGGGVFLSDYPAQAAALARLAPEPGEPGLFHAERWEFYFGGIELANCFSELCDGEEQSRRFAAARAARRELGEADYPLDREFLDSLAMLDCAAGVAMGIDRLVMVLTGAAEISAVRAII